MWKFTLRARIVGTWVLRTSAQFCTLQTRLRLAEENVYARMGAPVRICHYFFLSFWLGWNAYSALWRGKSWASKVPHVKRIPRDLISPVLASACKNTQILRRGKPLTIAWSRNLAELSFGKVGRQAQTEEGIKV